MPTFTGTSAGEEITPTTVSPTVVSDGASLPGNGPDTVLGFGGDDTIISGGGQDVISGGTGLDTVFMGAGNDIFRWAPGDGSDTVEGGADTDLLDFAGANISEKIDISANAGRARFFRDVANITMDIHGIENIFFHAVGGADTVTVGDLTGTGIKNVTIDLAALSGGSAGDGQVDSTIVNATASSESLTLSGGSGAVTVSGLAWRSRVLHAEASDQLRVFADTGKDTIAVTSAVASALALTIDGGVGKDTVEASATGGSNVSLLGNGSGELLQFGASVVSLANVEHLSLQAGPVGGSFTIGDLTGTVAGRVDVNLASPSGNVQSDTVTVNGTDAADSITLATSKEVLSVKGLPANIFLHHADQPDQLVINGGMGTNTIDASAVASGFVHLVLNGGEVSDLLIGSAGADVVSGKRGDDVALLGGGNDKFLWNPGDGSDTVEGQAGNDLLGFFGANIGERIDISANGGRVRFTRDVANITMDLNDVERIAFHAFGGADNITVNDLSGTDLRSLTLDLESLPGSGTGDGQADIVSLTGTGARDAVTISAIASGHLIKGLAANVNVIGQETIDAISLSTGAGNDSIDARATSAGYNFSFDSGFGNDTLTGGLSNDTFVFDTALNETSNVDTIRKFSVAADTMQLDDAVFAGIGATGTLTPAAFGIGSEATDTNQRVIYDSTTGRLYFDSDGSGAGDAVLFAGLQTGLSLTSSDFVVV